MPPMHNSAARRERRVTEYLPNNPHLHLGALVNSSDDAIISKNLDGIILSWNPAAERLFGYSAEEIIGKSILTLIPPERHHEEEMILDKLRAGGRLEHFETVRMRKGGERFPISVTISPIRDDSGKVIAASKIARDISERKRMEESRFRLAAIVDSADDAIISKDLNGIVQTWNRGAQKIFGYTADEMIGQPILRLFPDELKYEEDEILRKLRAGQRIDHYETVRKRKNGEPVEISVTISPICDETGTVIAASKIARDISDKKRMERLLLQSEKLAATGRMAAAVAHEINNPLESLINLIFLARQNSAPDSKASKLLATAEEEMERLSHIARQTLGYYKDTGSPTNVYLHELIENLLTVYNAKMMSAGIALDTRFNDMQKITVSKGEMLQVFSNVIANAIDAMREGGVLKISTRSLRSASKDGIQVVIQDNGQGIEQENLPKVFEPFFTTKGNVGTGIGLWVTKELLERRGGQISIASSRAPGDSGTTVTIFIPFAMPKSIDEMEKDANPVEV
ncbi:PAS domain-containing sensor histidine kinase [Occallatibacter riparius]|uniref:histidine kinase n=1 Tax=Occallatibacter riparius TaxID=1002689 RepID=A0A9J7BGU2_9BACT|nr:PAS domain-containing sensor histidine kinase [Occallatibacter riparius]UWZ82008.1 PAS domain S-box protein [Occallatibacter riparius]